MFGNVFFDQNRQNDAPLVTIQSMPDGDIPKVVYASANATIPMPPYEVRTCACLCVSRWVLAAAACACERVPKRVGSCMFVCACVQACVPHAWLANFRSESAKSRDDARMRAAAKTTAVVGAQHANLNSRHNQ